MVFQTDSQTYPVTAAHDLAIPTLQARQGVKGRLPKSLLERDSETLADKRLSLFFATYNVFTLDKHAGHFVGYLREQVQAHGIDVLFLQETRSKKSNMILSQTHIRIISESANGKGGTEIWLLRAGPANRGRGFDHAQVQVLHADAETLILKAKYKGTDLLLGSFHAPHSGHDSDSITAYWKNLARLLKPFLAKYHNFVFGSDANAHFAVPCDGCVGDFGLEGKTNVGGEAMKEFLREVQGFLPSTFEHIHEGQHYTWQSSANGSVSRCDYIICPCLWLHANVRSWVLHTLDTTKRAIDHWPLMVKATLTWTVHKTERPRQAFCRQKLAKATDVEMNELLSKVDVPEWTEDIDTHATRLSDQVHGLLCDSFPVTKEGPRKSFISDETWAIRKERICARRQTQVLRKQIASSSLHAYFLLGSRILPPKDCSLYGPNPVDPASHQNKANYCCVNYEADKTVEARSCLCI